MFFACLEGRNLEVGKFPKTINRIEVVFVKKGLGECWETYQPEDFQKAIAKAIELAGHSYFEDMTIYIINFVDENKEILFIGDKEGFVTYLGEAEISEGVLIALNRVKVNEYF